jgi:hypothetical protein
MAESIFQLEKKKIPQLVTVSRTLITLSNAKTPPKLIDGVFERGG